MQAKPRSMCAMLSLPGSRALTWETTELLRKCDAMFSEAGVGFTAMRVAGFDQAQARDELLARWLRTSDYEDGLFLDGDISCDPAAILTLAQLEEDLLVVPYEKRDTEPGDPTGWAIDTAGEVAHAEAREGLLMMPLRGAGLGCVRIRRAAALRMVERYGNVRALNWTSHHPETPGLPVTGLCTPLVNEHPDGSNVWRRRPEDMSFFVRARECGLTAYALMNVPVWHDARGGRTFRDGIQEMDRLRRARRRRVDFELRECPDDLLGLADVLDGAYDVPGFEVEAPRILDLGANIGAFAIWAGKRWPGARITCYEPHPRMAELCRRNLEVGDPRSEVDVICAAVVGEPSPSGRVRLYDGPFNQGERTIHPVPGVHLETCTEVHAVPVAELPPCDVLKVDTEGAEREILSGYPHLEGVRVVMAEWHSLEDYHWIRGWARENGFLCAVDRARGQPKADREIVFVRQGTMVEHEATG